jgi:chitin synthase
VYDQLSSFQDQNRTFRTRLVCFWLISNAALAISIQTLNGLPETRRLVELCLPADYNPINGSAIVPVNATCLTRAINSQTQDLEDKQQYYFMYLLWGTFGLSAVRFVGVSPCRDLTDSSACTIG